MDDRGGEGVVGEVGEGEEGGVDPPSVRLSGEELEGSVTRSPVAESTLLGGARRFCLRRKQWPVRNRTTLPRVARGCAIRKREKDRFGDGNQAFVCPVGERSHRCCQRWVRDFVMRE